MQFFKDRVITPFNTDKAIIGSYYIASNHALDLEYNVINHSTSSFKVLRQVDLSSNEPFELKTHSGCYNRSQFIYPVNIFTDVTPIGAKQYIEDDSFEELYFIKDNEYYRVYNSTKKELSSQYFNSIKDICNRLMHLTSVGSIKDFTYIF